MLFSSFLLFLLSFFPSLPFFLCFFLSFVIYLLLCFFLSYVVHIVICWFILLCIDSVWVALIWPPRLTWELTTNYISVFLSFYAFVSFAFFNFFLLFVSHVFICLFASSVFLSFFLRFILPTGTRCLKNQKKRLIKQVVHQFSCDDIISAWVNACDPCECACCSSSRRFEPWWPWDLSLLKFFIIIIIINIVKIIIFFILCWSKYNFIIRFSKSHPLRLD